MAKELSEADLKKLKDNARLLLANDRGKLVCRYPFVGNVAMKLDIVPVRDARCRTACTDGKTIYFDIAFLSELTESERLFVFAHEVWHNVMLHFARKQTRDAHIFNYATDMEVNQLLQKDGFQAPKDVVFPENYQLEPGLSAEQYYEKLLKKMSDKNDKSSQSKKDKNGKGGASQQTSGGNGKSKDNKNIDDEESNAGSGEKSAGNKDGKLSGQFDRHDYDGEGQPEPSEDGKTGVVDKYGDVGFDKDFHPSISQDAAEKMREAAIGAAQMAERQQGQLPGHIAGVIDQLKKPELKWQELLAQFVTRCMNGEKRNWCPPNRRHVWHDTYLQSRRGEKIKVVVAVDTSGSCMGDLPKFFTELMSLVKSFGRYELTLIQTDYAVSDFQEFDDSGNPFPEDVSEIQWHGGGGTSFTPAFDYIEDNGIRPDCFIYFTDGYGDVTCQQPDYPVMWVLTKDHSNDFCDWGEKIAFKNDSYNE